MMLFTVNLSSAKIVNLAQSGAWKRDNKDIDITRCRFQHSDLTNIRFYVFKVPIAANCKGVCLQNTSESHHTILEYGDYYDFMGRYWCGS